MTTRGSSTGTTIRSGTVTKRLYAQLHYLVMRERNDDELPDLEEELEIDLDDDWPAEKRPEAGFPEQPPSGFIIVEE